MLYLRTHPHMEMQARSQTQAQIKFLESASSLVRRRAGLSLAAWERDALGCGCGFSASGASVLVDAGVWDAKHHCKKNCTIF